MTHLDLFSGIGGFALAAQQLGWVTKQFVEIDKHCQKILEKNFPNVPIHNDIKTFNSKIFKGKIEIITGGFPCQPFSVAGKQRGTSDNRYLWPEMLRVIREIRPTYVVCENVPGIIKLAFEKVCSSLEKEKYTVESFIIPACSVGAIHRRNRVWIIAYSKSGSKSTIKSSAKKMFSLQKEERQPKHSAVIPGRISSKTTSNGISTRLQKRQSNSTVDKKTSFRYQRKITPIRDAWPTKPGICRADDGIPNRVDRIKGLGNAIVPQVALEIFKAIELTKHS